MNQTEAAAVTREKVNMETSKMRWRELQRFFASGMAVFVAPGLDLVEVAYQFSQDNKAQFEAWMQENKVGTVSDNQAKEWIEQDALMWAVVVKPWILVQRVEE